ncbi:unnamed protein product [Haemonchus placei]|uniref:Uncharacterized protein n=1 Tax=Haemonchus placei TaxID=6290 RepID=A0A0N4WVB1_HAEPC|nr:unnamed protein product [Haemonchus placei]
MGEVLVGGVWVPSAIAQHFKDEGHAPFSYTKPNLKFQPREVKLNIKTFQPHREQIFVEDYKRRLLKIAISKLDDDRGHRRRPLRRYSDVQQVATRPAAFVYPDRRGHMYKPLRRYNSELESLSTRPTTFIVPARERHTRFYAQTRTTVQRDATSRSSPVCHSYPGLFYSFPEIPRCKSCRIVGCRYHRFKNAHTIPPPSSSPFPTFE